jgi:hypothetical protein
MPGRKTRILGEGQEIPRETAFSSLEPNIRGVAAFDYAAPFYPGPGGPPQRRLQAALQISDHRLVWVGFWTNRDSE